MKITPKTVDEWLNGVSYANDHLYVPTDFALEFVTFIKMVNGGDGEENKTPVLHFKMLDGIGNIPKNKTIVRILNMVHRGAAKALSLDTQVLTPTGNVSVKDLCVGDIVIDRRGTPTCITGKSPIFNKAMYLLELEDGRKLKVSEDHINIVQKRVTGKNIASGTWKESCLTTTELVTQGVTYTRQVSDRNPSGSESKWYIPTSSPVELPDKEYRLDPYTIGVILGDGGINTDTGFTRIYTHTSDITEMMSNIPYKLSAVRVCNPDGESMRFSILGIGKLVKSVIGTSNVYGKRIPTEYLWGSINQRLEILRGLMDTDGTCAVKGNSVMGSYTTVSEGLANDVLWLVRSLGGEATCKYNLWKGFSSYRLSFRLGFNPFKLMRKATLWRNNLIGRTAIKSITAIDLEPSQCISVASETASFLAGSFVVTHNSTLMGEYLFLYLAVYGEIPNFGKIELALYVSDSIDNGVKTMRNNLEFRWQNSAFLQKYIPTIRFTDIKWIFTNIDGNTFIVKGYGACTGVRGTRELGKRPRLAVLDDLVSDEDARSETIISKIRDTVNKALAYALHPSRNMIVWSGTPFNASDPLYLAVESGAWDVNVYPVCETFPCTKEEFRGSWEDRFTYEYVKTMYDLAVDDGSTAGFNQELMLRIMSDDDRLIHDADIRWYKLERVLKNRANFNFYITTDYTTSEKQHADFAVTSVWAYNNVGDWFWVDGRCARQTMDKNMEDLFNYVQIYKPMGVGIEVSGQQEGFIPWIQDQMLVKNMFFTLVSSGNSNKPGIRPSTGKLTRFNIMVPMFKMGKMYFPEEKKSGIEMGEMLNELSLASVGGFKSKHDDFIDTISMLSVMKPFKPSEASGTPVMGENGLWDMEDVDNNEGFNNSYVV